MEQARKFYMARQVIHDLRRMGLASCACGNTIRTRGNSECAACGLNDLLALGWQA